MSDKPTATPKLSDFNAEEIKSLALVFYAQSWPLPAAAHGLVVRASVILERLHAILESLPSETRRTDRVAAEATGDFYCEGEQLRSSLKCTRPCDDCWKQRGPDDRVDDGLRSEAVDRTQSVERVLTIDEVEDAYNAASMYAVKEWHGYQAGNWNVKADFAAALCKLALKALRSSARQTDPDDEMPLDPDAIRREFNAWWDSWDEAGLNGIDREIAFDAFYAAAHLYKDSSPVSATRFRLTSIMWDGDGFINGVVYDEEKDKSDFVEKKPLPVEWNAKPYETRACKSPNACSFGRCDCPVVSADRGSDVEAG